MLSSENYHLIHGGGENEIEVDQQKVGLIEFKALNNSQDI